MTLRKWARRFVACLFSSCFTAASAQTLYVDPDATEPPDGQSWCSAFVDLQSALNAATPGTTVRVAEGRYVPDPAGLPDPRAATFSLLDGVVLEGGYAGCGASNPDFRDIVGLETVLSGDFADDDGPAFSNYEENAYHVLTYSDVDAVGTVLDGFTVSGGHADGEGGVGVTNQGGAIHIRNGIEKCIAGGPTIRNCTIRDNWALHHGAINDHALSSIIENCTIRDNFAGTQGAGLLVHSGNPIISNTIFINNTTDGSGGGAWNGRDVDPACEGSLARPIYVDCHFEGNTAFQGAGMANEDGAPIVIRSTFVNNDSVGADSKGGGMWSIRANPTVVSSIFLENSATKGGGLYVTYGHQLLVNSRFFGNVASNVGGGLYAIGIPTRSTTPELVNCVLAGNHALAAGAIYSYGSLPIITNCTLFSNTASGITGGIELVGEGTGSHAVITNSILFDNHLLFGNGDSIETLQLFKNEISIAELTDTCLEGWTGSLGGAGNFGDDPVFVDRAGEDGVPGTVDDDLHLLTGSPCIDAGDVAALPEDVADLDDDGETTEQTPFDLDSRPRVLGATVDLGAYESGCPTAAPLEAVQILNAAGAFEVLRANRVLSIHPPETFRPYAIRVTFNDLPEPFDIWNGAELWAAEPEAVCNGGSGNLCGPIDPDSHPEFFFRVASLQCAGPVYVDWSVHETVYVYHEGIVPEGVYSVRAIEEGCLDFESEGSYSTAVVLAAAEWGDTVEDLTIEPPGPPNDDVAILDILAILARFSGIPGAVAVPRADLEPSCLDFHINISDALAGISGFQGLTYPFAPTAALACESTCLPILP